MFSVNTFFVKRVVNFKCIKRISPRKLDLISISFDIIFFLKAIESSISTVKAYIYINIDLISIYINIKYNNLQYLVTLAALETLATDL